MGASLGTEFRGSSELRPLISILGLWLRLSDLFINGLACQSFEEENLLICCDAVCLRVHVCSSR